MSTNYAKVSEEMDFFKSQNPFDLVNTYDSPLYVYNETIFRKRCREMKNLVSYKNFSVSFSAKANSNLRLLEIVKEEGLNVDAMSPGEIHVQEAAGFEAKQIFYICNNVSKEEMQYAIDHNVIVSVDSISQLIMFGEINPGGEVAIRFNPGYGAGHSEKVITAGENTKFGVDTVFISEVKEILTKYNLNLVGINQHVGSLFMEGSQYVNGVKSLLSIAEQFDDLEFVDMGGGFGIPYKKQDGQEPLDIVELGQQLDDVIKPWVKKYGKEIEFKIEPGRYISAECGILLGTVFAKKQNYAKKYIGTDIGFNVIQRPVMYDSHHDIEIYKKSGNLSTEKEIVSVVGNICESGDILSKDMSLPIVEEGDLVGMLDAGAYGYVMSSTYNNRLRPAEVLILENGETKLIRRRDTFEDIMRNFI